MQIPEVYYQFWAQAFDVPLDHLKATFASVVTKGRYVARHGEKYIFCYSDLLNGKRMLALGPQTFSHLEILVNDWLSSDAITGLDLLDQSLERSFADVDYIYEPKLKLNIPELCAFKISHLFANDKMRVTEYLKRLSDNDADTLDLNLEIDVAVAAVDSDGRVLGIARHSPLPGAVDLTDITVVVAPGSRGKGIAKSLVFSITQSALKKGLLPKYRVAEDNHPSRAIAESLGLKAAFKLATYKSSGG